MKQKGSYKDPAMFGYPDDPSELPNHYWCNCGKPECYGHDPNGMYMVKDKVWKQGAKAINNSKIKAPSWQGLDGRGILNMKCLDRELKQYRGHGLHLDDFEEIFQGESTQRRLKEMEGK